MSFLCGDICIKSLNSFILIVSGGVMAFALLISIYYSSRHLKYYNHPHFQDRIIHNLIYNPRFHTNEVILFMAPFYAITSYLGIIFVVCKTFLSWKISFYSGIIRVFRIDKRYLWGIFIVHLFLFDFFIFGLWWNWSFTHFFLRNWYFLF